MKKKHRGFQSVKHPLYYAITPTFEERVRDYVEHVQVNTGLSASCIVTDLLIDAILRAEKFSPLDSENSKTAKI